jgi:hypothetical protein
MIGQMAYAFRFCSCRRVLVTADVYDVSLLDDRSAIGRLGAKKLPVFEVALVGNDVYVGPGS